MRIPIPYPYHDMIKKPRLTRAQIRETLEQVPMEAILLGHSTSKEKRLTPSQIKFAEEIANGKTKAEAYRNSRPNGRKSKAKPQTQSKRGQELAKDGAIQGQIDAFKLAIEAQKYATPLHLRALVIHKLTEKALDAEVPPAQQIKALELLGKLTEVGAFTERREVTNITDSSTMRAKLLNSIKLALSSQGATVIDQADDLLAELAVHDSNQTSAKNNNVIDEEIIEADHGESEGEWLPLQESTTDQTHDTPNPKNQPVSTETLSHSNPLIQSPPNENHAQLTPVSPKSESNTE